MESNSELFNKLATKFLKVFSDYEKEVYEKEVIERIDNKTFREIYNTILRDNNIKYFPRPIDFERMEYNIKHAGY